jgi:hypothetical protein
MKRYSIWDGRRYLSPVGAFRRTEEDDYRQALIRQVLDRYIGATDMRFERAVHSKHVDPDEREKS